MVLFEGRYQDSSVPTAQLIYVLQTVYYYFLGLKIGNEHKSNRTLQKHE